MAISANVMNIETTESGTTVITLSLPDFCHTITAPENYINGLPVIAAQPYGVIMVEEGAADDMPVVCMNNNKQFFSIALSDLMAADVHDTISFATPYVFPEDIDTTKYLAGLEDVEITDPVEAQILAYNATKSKWENKSYLWTLDDLMPITEETDDESAYILNFELTLNQGYYTGYVDERDMPQDVNIQIPDDYCPVIIEVDGIKYDAICEPDGQDHVMVYNVGDVYIEIAYEEQHGFRYKQSAEAEAVNVAVYAKVLTASPELFYLIYNMIHQNT